jgi:electron transfer flavoprotein alpha subunit
MNMSNILVFLQQNEGKLPKVTRSAVKAAYELKTAWGSAAVIGIVAGNGANKAADEALKLGLAKVLVADSDAIKNYLAVNYAELVVKAANAEGCSVIVAAATTTGKDLMPRVAAMIDAVQASDIIAVNSNGTLKRPMYAGDVIADVELAPGNRVVTVRGTAFAPQSEGGAAGTKVDFAFQPSGAIFSEFVSYETSKSERPELSDAEIVVSGGRALKSSETFMQVMAPLADVFGAAIGASRAAVDSGYAPNDWQVGQTGKVVAPSLYVAVGISGAIQHLAGMKDSKVVVAINKDPEAPIFEIADYGLVADLYEAVPKLVDEVKKAKG